MDAESIVAHRIAEAFGVPVRALDEILDASEFAAWAEYFAWCDDRRSRIEYALAQCAGYASGRERWRLSDFLLPSCDDEHARPQTVSVEQAAELLMAMYGPAARGGGG